MQWPFLGLGNCMAGVQVEPVSSSEDCSREESDHPPETRTDPFCILTAAASDLALSSGVVADQLESIREKQLDCLDWLPVL